MTIKQGQRLTCNGHDGTITKVCTGQLTGMIEVRVPGGPVCVSIHDLKLENPDLR